VLENFAAVSLFRMGSLAYLFPETAQAQANSLPLPLSTLSLSVVLPCTYISCPWRSHLQGRAEQPAPPGQAGTISNRFLLARSARCPYQLLSDALLSWVNQSPTHLLTKAESSLKALQAMILPAQPGLSRPLPQALRTAEVLPSGQPLGCLEL